MNKFRSLKISYQFLLNCLALLSFFITLGCIQKGDKKNLPIEDGNNQMVVETNSSESNSSWVVEFREDFSKVEIGSEPESLFILDGAYSVQTDTKNNKILTLPGSPMGDFGLLFGPRIRDKALELQFSFFTTKKGRRMPSVAAGIGGVRGLRLRLNPAARKLVLSMNDSILKELPFKWVGDQWWSVRFQMIPANLNQSTIVQFKLWPKLEKEPTSWSFIQTFDIQYMGGKCALWGFPYASTPIQFDDLTILSK